MYFFRNLLKYLWPQIYKYRIIFFLVILLMIARVIIDFIIIPIYFKKFIDLISTNTADHVFLVKNIFNIVFIIISCNLLVAVLARSRQYIYVDFMIKIVQNLRNFAFAKIEHHSYSFFSNTFTGSLVTKVRRFINGFEIMFDIFLFNFLTILVILSGVFVVLIKESKIISIVLFLMIFLYIGIVFILLKKKMKYDLLEAEQDSKISGRIADVFSNILAVKFFSARNNEIKLFSKYTEEGANRSRKAFSWSNRIDIVQSFFSFAIHSVLLYVLASLWLDEKISTGTVVLVEAYTTSILIKLWDLGNSLTRFMKASTDMKEMIDIFEIVPDILDPKNPEELRIKEGHIVFNNIVFNYGMKQEIFNNFYLEIKPDEKVGIVGHSGAGKSTITKLLLRFNDVVDGSILIDGQDIRNIKQEDLRSVISYVPQEPILFHRSIRENISYGKFDATDEEIIAVSKKAHAYEFISLLNNKYDTKVGERGVKLSGGERQRIAIARAMLKDAPILILDEATSSLDSVSESFIQDALSELMKSKTTIVIAHRLSTIQKMDRIIVLDKGSIVESGTHKELLEKNGFYSELWNHQTGGFL